MWGGLVGVLAGTAASNAVSPWRELGRLFTRIDPSFTIVNPVIRDAGQVVTLLALIVLGHLVVRARRAAPDPLAEALAPLAGDAAGWLAAAIGLALALRVGPGANGPLLMPAVLALCVAAWPIVRVLTCRPVPRAIVIAVVVVVHAVMWPTALARQAALHRAFVDRLAAIARTPPDQIARVAPYRHVIADAWTVGDDWNDVDLREALARDHFGVRDLELAPAFTEYEASPALALALEVDGATPAQVTAAAPPPSWPRSLPRARLELAAFARRLHAAAPAAVARLAITDPLPAWPARGDRPVYAAWSDVDRHPLPAARHTRPDDTGRVTAKLGQLDGVWVVRPDAVEPLACPLGVCSLVVEHKARIVIVACDHDRCAAADAWVPVL
jgi:hypothetical protein